MKFLFVDPNLCFSNLCIDVLTKSYPDAVIHKARNIWIARDRISKNHYDWVFIENTMYGAKDLAAELFAYPAQVIFWAASPGPSVRVKPANKMEIERAFSDYHLEAAWLKHEEAVFHAYLR